MREITFNPHKAMTDEERNALAVKLAEIERASFSDPWSEKAFSESFDNSAITLVTLSENGLLLAYALYAVLAPEAELLNLAVSPNTRRGGVATALLDAADAMLKDAAVSDIFLEVRESNTAARALYTVRGFLPIGKRKHYYRYPTEDAIVMMCRLD